MTLKLEKFDLEWVDISEVEGQLGAIAWKAPVFISRGFNDATKRTITQMIKAIRGKYDVKRSTVNRRIDRKLIEPKEVIGGEKMPEVSIRMHEVQPPSLASFGRPSQGKKGVRVTVEKGNRELYRRAFIHERAGTKLIFRRKAESGKTNESTADIQGPLVSRMPLEVLRGDSLVAVVQEPAEKRRLEDFFANTAAERTAGMVQDQIDRGNT